MDVIGKDLGDQIKDATPDDDSKEAEFKHTIEYFLINLPVTIA
jgi:hypothetical protein